MSDPHEMAKRLVGEAAVDRFVDDGTCIGLGTGTTAIWAIRRVGERVRNGESIVAVATSVATEAACAENGITVVPFYSREMDVAIDGADEISPDFALTKGGGGALFREKCVAIAARRFVVIADESKLVQQLGAFPTPIEIVPYALPWVRHKLEQQFPNVQFSERRRDGDPFITDNGNLILDGHFGIIDEPRALDARLRTIHGVVAAGLFYDVADDVLIGGPDGVREVMPVEA
jgi:ribose 5-phosphate isomerase A